MSDEFRREQERQTKQWEASFKSMGDHYSNSSSRYADYNPHSEKDARQKKWLISFCIVSVVGTIVWFIIMASG